MFTVETTKFYVNLENMQVYIDRYYVFTKDINLVKTSFILCLFSLLRAKLYLKKVGEIEI